jgi:hypothetical protein
VPNTKRKAKMAYNLIRRSSSSSEDLILRCANARRMSMFLLALLICSTNSVAASQSNVLTTDDRELTSLASHILIGQVVDVESVWNNDKTLIFSYVTISIENCSKGDYQGEEAVVKAVGGEVWDVGLQVSNEPVFAKGEKVKVFLKVDENGEFRVVGGNQGKVSLNSVTSASGSFKYSGIHWADADIPVGYFISTTVPSTWRPVIQQCFQTWEDVPGSYMDYTYNGTTNIGAPHDLDGFNVVSYGNIDGANGTLAYCCAWYYTANRTLIETDIVFDNSETWSTASTCPSNAFDVQNVGTHEVGHTLLLNDLYDPADSEETMYGYAELGETKKRTLNGGDIVGIRYIYPAIAQEYRYMLMEGITTSCGDLPWIPKSMHPWFWTIPFHTRPPSLTPLLMERNITFSDPDPVTGVVYLTVPAESYVGLNHIWYAKPDYTWWRLRVSMTENGYGWLFTGEGTSPINGDVDYYTFSNNTGVYWGSESSKAGELAASTAQLPIVGADGIAGTEDDGFVDGTADPCGSSILLLPSELYIDFWTGSEWNLFIDATWSQVFTTGTAYNIVDESTSEINGCNSTGEGEPWEFFAGLDHPEYGLARPWNHTYSNAYVSYTCVWSMLEFETAVFDLDILYRVDERLVRLDCVIADIDGDELVDMSDIVICSLTFGARDEGPGPDGQMGTADDMPIADPNFDARGDIADVRGLIDAVDMVRIAINFGWKLTPDGIIKP